MVAEPNPTSCTFSILARDAATNSLGMAIAGSNLAVAARCSYLDPRSAVIACQGFTNLKTGPLVVDLLGSGLTGEELLDVLNRHDRWIETRQIAVISATGEMAVHTGSEVRDWAGHWQDGSLVCIANSLRDSKPMEAMRDAFLASPNSLMADRLVRGLEAANSLLAPEQKVLSSAVMVSSDVAAEVFDLRIDRAGDQGDPRKNAVPELRALLDAYIVVQDFYVRLTRAPAESP